MTSKKAKPEKSHKNQHSHCLGSMICPECGSSRVFNNGHRYRKDGTDTQRFICSRCGQSFSQNYIKRFIQARTARICALAQVENLDNVTEMKTVTVDKDLSGKVIDYLNRLERQGYSLATRKLNATCLRILKEKGANLADPETIKDVLVKQARRETAFKGKPWSCYRRRNMINAYTQFLKFCSLSWEQPRNVIVRKNPFIPTEQELDDLIARPLRTKQKSEKRKRA